MEPVGIWGMGAIFEQAVEGEKSARTVVEDSIQDNTHAARMDFMDQVVEIGVGAEYGIDAKVIGGMIAVVGATGKYGA